MRSSHSPYRYLVILFLLIAAILRLYSLDEYPLLMNQDELSVVYDAYSIAETGSDRFERNTPILLRGFGIQDYRPALQAWLIAIPYSFIAFDPVIGRIVSAFIGLWTLWLLFLLVKRMGNPNLAIIALGLAAFSPWHLLYSRMAHEGAVLPAFFAITALLLWQQARNRKFTWGWVILTGYITGFSANAYPACRITGLLLAIGFGADLLWQTMQKKQTKWFGVFALLALAALVGAAPQIWAYLQEPDHFLGRARGVLHPDLSIGIVLQNILLNLSPDHLFLSSGKYNNLSLARAIPAEMPFFYLGVLGFWWILPNQLKGFKRLLLWAFIACILPAAFTEDNPHALRASAMSLMIPIFSATGIYGLWLLLSRVRFIEANLRNSKTVFIAIISTLLLFSWSQAAIAYTHSFENRNLKHQQEVVMAAQWATTHDSAYDSVFVVEPFANQAYIYFTVFGNMPPAQFQQTPKKFMPGCDCYCLQMGKYAFVADSTLSQRLTSLLREIKPLIISRNPPSSNNKLLHQIDWLDHHVYFYEP